MNRNAVGRRNGRPAVLHSTLMFHRHHELQQHRARRGAGEKVTVFFVS